MTGEKGIPSTTTMEDDWLLLNTSNKQIVSILFSKKPTNTPLVSQPGKIRPKLIVFEKYDDQKEKSNADQQHICSVLEENINCTTHTVVCIRH
jgi:hypothetical protein